MTTVSAESRIDYKTVAPQAIQALWAVEQYARGCQLEPALLELVKLRASMIGALGQALAMVLYGFAREHFDERQLVDLTMVIIAINSWNRLAIAFRAVPGTYEPIKQHSAG